MEKALERKGQCILYGPPGTGKTYTARRYVEWKNRKGGRISGDLEQPNVEMVTFHPSFSYEDFIEGFKPVASEQGTISFELQQGIFYRLCARAGKTKIRSTISSSTN